MLEKMLVSNLRIESRFAREIKVRAEEGQGVGGLRVLDEFGENVWASVKFVVANDRRVVANRTKCQRVVEGATTGSSRVQACLKFRAGQKTVPRINRHDAVPFAVVVCPGVPNERRETGDATRGIIRQQGRLAVVVVQDGN